MPFIKVHCSTGDGKNVIKGTLRKEWLSANWQIDLEDEERKYDVPEKNTGR